jgi:hypothetical protein
VTNVCTGMEQVDASTENVLKVLEELGECSSHGFQNVLILI